MFDWNDLKYLLEISRNRTLSAAARSLGVNQTTVGRRLSVLEQSIGSRLFDRIDQRMIPTVAGAIAIKRAERIETEVMGTAVEIAGRDRSTTGKVRVTSISMVINMLAARVDELVAQYPGIQLELLDSQENLDLAHLEADIALRFARPTMSAGVVRRLGSAGFHVYAARRFADRGDALPWVAYAESKDRLPEARWLNQQLQGKPAILRVSDVNAMLHVVPNLPCRTLLPRLRVRPEMDLVTLSGTRPVLKRDVWLLYMKALQTNSRIKAVARWASKVCVEQLD